MKNLKAPFLVIALLLLNISFAGSHELPPPNAGTLNSDGSELSDDDIGGATPPNFPVNQNISFLLLGGLAIGAVAVYKNQIKKASI